MKWLEKERPFRVKYRFGIRTTMEFVAYLCVYVTFAMNAQCTLNNTTDVCAVCTGLWTQMHLHAGIEVNALAVNNCDTSTASENAYMPLRVPCSACVYVGSCAATILLQTLYNFTCKQAYNLLNSKNVRTSGWRKHGTLKWNETFIWNCAGRGCADRGRERKRRWKHTKIEKQWKQR